MSREGYRIVLNLLNLGDYRALMNPTVTTLIGISIIFLATTLGAVFVFFIHKDSSSPPA